MINKIKYVLIGIASLYAHAYLFYLITTAPPVWWVFPTMVLLVGTLIASGIYMFGGLMPSGDES